MSISGFPFVSLLTGGADVAGTCSERTTDMDYVVLLYQDPATFNMTEAERNAEYAEYGTFTEGIKKNGTFIDGSPVDPAGSRLVRVVGGKTEVMNGQLPSRKEALVGYYKLKGKNADEIATLVAKLPTARKGFIEILPEMEM
jgi:hypothetical protein